MPRVDEVQDRTHARRTVKGYWLTLPPVPPAVVCGEDGHIQTRRAGSIHAGLDHPGVPCVKKERGILRRAPELRPPIWQRWRIDFGPVASGIGRALDFGRRHL